MVWLEIFNFVHFLGLAFGLGGATLAAIISRKSERDSEIGKLSFKIMPSISKLIFFGLVLLIISGIALPFFIAWPLNKELLIVKHVLVAWIVVIGIILGRSSKKIFNLAPVGREKPSLRYLRTKKKIKLFSMINLVLWYVVTLISAFV